MNIKKCVQCGGNLERLPMKRAWLCPYCGARYEEEGTEKTAAPKEYHGLSEEVLSAWGIKAALREDAEAFADENYPDWENPLSYWEESKTKVYKPKNLQ